MAISFVGLGAAGFNFASLPAFQVGDLAVVFAYRDGNQTPPSLPAGWTNLASTGANSNSFRAGYRILQGGDTTTGTWTNATAVEVVVLRGQHATTPIGPNLFANGAVSATISYSAPLTLSVTDGSSWVLGMAGHRTATDLNNSVSGMTTRNTGAGTELSAHTQQVSSWPTSKTLSVNASSGWRSVVLEVVAAAPKQTGTADISLAGGQVPSVRTGHSIVVRARKTEALRTGVLRIQLFEGATARSSVIETPELTTALAEYVVAIPQADATNIASYANLSVRIQGYSAAGTGTVFEVADVVLLLPGGAAGSSFGAVTAPFTFDAAVDGVVTTGGDKTTGTFEVSLAPGVVPIGTPATSVLDDGNQANENPLSQSGAWTTLSGVGALQIVSNQIKATTAYSCSYRGSYTSSEAYVQLGTIAAVDGEFELLLRLTDTQSPIRDTNKSGYRVAFDGKATYAIGKYVDGVYAELRAFTAWGGGALADADRVLGRVVGSTIEVWAKRGTAAWAREYSMIDPTPPLAGPGAIGLLSESTTNTYEEFGGGETVSTHSIVVRARKTNGAHTGTIRAQLYEGATPRSAELESSALTTSLATYSLPVAYADSAPITDYSNLSVRVRGYSTAGDATVVEVADLYLTQPLTGAISYTGAVSLTASASITVGQGAAVPIYPGAAVFPHPLITVSSTATVTAATGGILRFGAVTAPFVLTVSTTGQLPGVPFGAAVLNSTATIAAAGSSLDRIGQVVLASVASVTITSFQTSTGAAAVAATATITVGGDGGAPPPPPGFMDTLPHLPDVLVAVAFASTPLETVPAYSDVAGYVRNVNTKRGRQFELDRIEAGTAHALLDNRDGRFNPENTASPYYPNIKPTRRIRVAAAWNAITYDLFNGFLEGYPQEYPHTGFDRVVSQQTVDAYLPLALARFIPGSTTLTSEMVTPDVHSDTVGTIKEYVDVGSTALPMPQTVPFQITLDEHTQHPETMTVLEIRSATTYLVERASLTATGHTFGATVTTTAVTFAEELTGTRIENVLARFNLSIGTVIDDGIALLAASEDLAGQSPIEHLQQVAEAEQGRLFVDGAGILRFQSRHHFYLNETVNRSTFGDGGGTELTYTDVAVTHDDTKLFNIVRITPASGNTQESRDQQSVNDHFERPLEKTWPLADDNEAKDAADYLLSRLSRMQVRIPALALNGSNDPDGLWPTILGLEIGQRYGFKLRPKDGSQMIDKTLVVEGVAHTFAPDSLRTNVQLSLADTTSYWRLESGDSRLGTNTRLAY